MKHITQQASGTWRVRLRRNGRMVDKTFDKKEWAVTYRDKIQWEDTTQDWQWEEATCFTVGETPPQASVTVKDAIEAYQSSLPLPGQKRSTVRIYDTALTWWLSSKIANIEATSLRKKHIEDAIPLLSHSRKPRTVNGYIDILAIALRWFCEREEIVLPLSRFPKLKDQRKLPQIPSDDEVNKLLAGAKESRSKNLYAIIAVCLGTAGRIREVLHLRREDVKILPQNEIEVVFRETKTGTERKAFLFGEYAQILLNHLQSHQEALVFPGRGGKVMNYPRHQLANLSERLGINIKSFHPLRRYSVSKTAAVGGLGLAQRLTGHSSLAMLERYIGGTDKGLRDVQKRIQE